MPGKTLGNCVFFYQFKCEGVPDNEAALSITLKGARGYDALRLPHNNNQSGKRCAPHKPIFLPCT